MDIEKIRYFRTMMEVVNLRKAAGILNITPGALSKSLKSLAFQLDIILFIQQGRNLIPTSEAELLYQSSERLVREYESMLQVLEESSNSVQSFKRVGTFEIFSTLFMADYIEKKTFPIEVHEYTPGYIEDALIKNLIDLGISYMPILHKDLSFEKTSKIRFAVFGNKTFKGYHFDELPFAVPGSKSNQNMSQALSLDGWTFRPRKVNYRFEMLQTALELASRSQCVLYCPVFIIKLFNQTLKSKYQLEEIPLNFLNRHKCTQDVYLIKKASSSKDLFYKEIEKELRALN